MRAYWRLVMWLLSRSHRRALHRALREEAAAQALAAGASEHVWGVGLDVYGVENPYAETPPTPVWHWHVNADGTRHIHVYDHEEG